MLLKGGSAVSNKKQRWNYGKKGVYKRRLKSGQAWYFWYYDESGNRKRVSAPNARSREDAIAALERKVLEVFNKRHGNKNREIAFKEFAPMYMKKYAIPKKRSHRTDQGFLDNHLIPHFGDLKLMDITAEYVSDFVAAKKRDGYMGSTINKQLQVLSRMMNIAEEFGYKIDNNPVRRRLHFQNEVEYRRTRVLTQQEESRLMKEAAPHLKPIIQCALLQGMRLQEILHLKVSDLDFEAGTITIRAELNKTGKLDVIPIRDELLPTLKELIADNGGRSPYLFNYHDPGSNEYRPIVTIQRSFREACRRAEIEGLQFRDLRRTCSTRLHEAGVDPLLVSRLLRHSSAKISTEVYIQSSLRMMKEALRRADLKSPKKRNQPAILAHNWHTDASSENDENKRDSITCLFSMN
jgi:integrase